MKLVKKENEEKGFEPFELTLKVETDGEARLLWHIFNRCFLKHDIFDGAKGKYNLDKTANGIHNEAVRDFLEGKIIGPI